MIMKQKFLWFKRIIFFLSSEKKKNNLSIWILVSDAKLIKIKNHFYEIDDNDNDNESKRWHIHNSTKLIKQMNEEQQQQKTFGKTQKKNSKENFWANDEMLFICLLSGK